MQSTVETLTIEEWKAANPDLVNQISEEEGGAECRECQGTGKHECDCGHEHTCYYCNGTGKNNSIESVLRELFAKQKVRDLKNLERWQSAVVPA
jgi:hypothetical protein